MGKFTRAEIRRIIGEGCTSEMEDAFIALHHSIYDPIAEDLRVARESADRLPTVQKELDDLKKAQQGDETYKLKYEALVRENQQKAENEAKTGALRSVLKEIGIGDKRIDTILRVTDLSGIKLAADGTIEGADTLKNQLKTEWADFVTTKEAHQAQPATPPQNTGGKKYSSRDEIMAIKDTVERQRAIAENIEFFR